MSRFLWFTVYIRDYFISVNISNSNISCNVSKTLVCSVKEQHDTVVLMALLSHLVQ